jgi:hypothetical protein
MKSKIRSIAGSIAASPTLRDLSVTSARSVVHSVLHLHEVDRSSLPKRRVLTGAGMAKPRTTPTHRGKVWPPLAD